MKKINLLINVFSVFLNDKERITIKTKAIFVLILLILSGLIGCHQQGETQQENVPFVGGPENPASDGSYTPKIESSNGVASLEEVTLGGEKQWILIRGYDVTKPVLIYLHGGPGSPCIFYSRYSMGGLERDFVVVSWDQRGCGKSYHPNIDPNSITLEQLLSDTHELILMMRERFGVERVYLMGISWGSILGSFTARNHPELLHAYIGISQVVDIRRSIFIAYQVLLDTAVEMGNQEAIDELSGITILPDPGYIPSDNDLDIIFKWLEEFGYGDLHNTSLYDELRDEIGDSSEYTSENYGNNQNWVNLYKSSPLEQDQTWKWSLNLIEQIPLLDVPIFFFSGRFDYKTPYILVEEYYNGLAAPVGKQIIGFENSAHMPNIEERDAFHDALINIVLPSTDSSQGF